MDSSHAHARVKISNRLKCKSDSSYNDFYASTTSKCVKYNRCGDRMYSFNEASCDLCGTKIMMSSTTNECVESFLWKIISACNNRIVMQSEINLSPHATRAESKCLLFGNYILVVRCSESKEYRKPLLFVRSSR